MNIRKFTNAVLAASLLASFSIAGLGQESDHEQKIDAIFAPWNSSKTPGATVAVVKDGKTIFKKGYGMANLEYDIANRPDTVFHIASVSKQFATFAVLLLEADGKLSLDDDIRKHIEEVPDFGKKITLRHLAHHTSGLRDQWALIALAGGRLDDVITTEHILKLVKRQKELNFEPGAEYLYSNTGYTLLAEVVARVSGKSFAKFTSERIFKPLKMSNTLFYDDHEKIVRNRAYSYYRTQNGFKKAVLSYANVGATSLFTTVEDLALWSNNFENPVVGSKALIAKMKKKGVLNNSVEINYALGQVVGSFRGNEYFSHSGGDAGYRTFLGRMPGKRLSVIMFSNDSTFNSSLIARRVLDVFLDTKEAASTASVKAPTQPAEAPAVAAVKEKTLREYVGSYELNPSVIIKVTLENGKLFGEATGQPKLPLQPTSKSTFVVPMVQAKLSFHRDESGKVNLLKLNLGGGTQEAKRIEEFNPDEKSLADYTGYFYSPELMTGYTLSVKDRTLVASHSRTSDIRLRPTKKDNFVGNTWFLGQMQFSRDRNGRIVGFRISNGRVRNLEFLKK